MPLNLDDYKTKKPAAKSGLNLDEFKAKDEGVLSKIGGVVKNIGKDLAGLAQKGIDTIAETKPFREAAEGLEAEGQSFGTHTAKFLFDTSKSYFDKVTGALSETKFMKEAAAGLEAIDRGEVQGDTLDFLGVELTKNLSEFGKSVSGRGTANVIETMVASPLNFATRSIYGKSNPVGDFFSDFADEMRLTFSTETSRKVSEQEFNFDKVKSADFWLTSVAENVPVTLAFMKAAALSYGASAKLTSLFGKSKFAQIAAGTVNAVAGGTTMRAFESAAEAEETYKQAKSEGMSEKKAIAAGRQVFGDNMKLLGLDAFQVAVALAPVKFGAGSVLGTILRETAALGAGAVSEGGEEVYQYGSQQRALGKTDLSTLQLAMTDPKAQEAGFIGAVMGIVFQAGGRINEYGNEKIRAKYLDDVATKMGVEFTDAYSKLKTADEKQAFLDTVAQSREKDVQEAVKAVEEDHQKAAQATAQAYETIRNTPQESEVKAALDSGKSPNEVALELSRKVGTEEALALVNEVVSRETEAKAVEAAKTPEKPKTALEDTKKALADITDKVDESVLEKTPADIQGEFEAAQKGFEESIAQLQKDVSDLKDKVTAAPDRSAQKRLAKEQLIRAQNQLKKAEEDFNAKITNQAGAFRNFLGDYISNTFAVELSEQDKSDVIDNIVLQLTDPTALAKNISAPLKNLIARELSRFAGGEIGIGDTVNITDKKGGKKKGKVLAVRKGGLLIEDAETNLPMMFKNEVFTFEKVKKEEKPKTQKEKVKEAVKKKGKASIKDIAKETGILEPNIRRILGVGAKEGEFERVADGVYRIVVGEQEVAVIIPADARETLPELAKQGFKADMVFLDIPYDTPAVKGGNRGVNYNLISVEDFDKILDATKTILRDENAPVIHFFSQAPSGMKKMQAYNDLFATKGFIPLGRGEYQKTFANGDPVTSPNGKVAKPEGILVFNQSGKFDTELSLNFKMVRPKGYQTEKPAEMIRQLVAMTTEEGDVILDPFAGSGVVPAEAVKAGRKAVAIEKDKDVAEKITKKRVEEAAKQTKTTVAVGDRFDTNGNTNMKGIVTVTSIEGRTAKFRDEEGTDYAGMEVSLVRKLIEGGSWTRIDKTAAQGDNKDNGKQADQRGGGRDNGEGVSETLPSGTDEQGGAGGAVDVAGQSARGQKRSGADRTDTGKRPSARLTNEEIASLVSDITRVMPSGEVVLTGEVTERDLEAANQYTSGGVAKEGRGILDEYYTNTRIVDMVKSLFDFPAKPMKVLEPAVGTGNFLYALPEIGTHTVVAHEINDTTARIAKIFHNNAKVYATSFETNFIDERGNKKEFTADYDLVIGNPPYGDHRGKYRGLGEENSIARYEDYFVKRGLDVLKEGGTLAMVLPSTYLDRQGSMSGVEIVAAFRLPEGVFEGTQVGTDIVVLRKKKGAMSEQGTAYFKNHPENVLGTTKERTNRFGKQETYVEGTLDDAITLFYENNNAKEAIQILKELGVEPTQENVENAEEAIDEAGTRAKELVKQAQKQGKKTIEKKIIKTSAKKGAPVSLTAQFEGQFSEEELAAWQDTQADGSLKNPEKHKTLANFMDGKWYIDFNYAQGDIYEKLRLLELEKKTIGDEQYEKQKALLEAVKPRRESIDDLKLSPNIGFVKDLKFGVEVSGNEQLERTLRSAFLKWIQELPRQAFGDSSAWEVREYVNNEQVRGSDKDRNELIRNRRKIMADALFAKFLKEGLDESEKETVEDAYNATFNFYHTPDYKQVPMFSEVHGTFQGKPLSVRDVQKHGIGRLVNTGVGILAHDVGFGKTMSGILAMHETMSRGWAKRPLIIVPNENVYRQWVNTIEDLIPNAKLNLLGNLGAGFKGDLSTLAIEEGSITLLTYEGFKRLGFKDDTYASLGGKFQYIADDLEKHKSERDQEKSKARAETAGGKMKKGTRADLSFEDLGFDHITFDEVHNANHIVSKVKLPKGQASEFNRFSLRPSDLGIKTWIAAQYVQEKNGGRNVNLLSATPFTNHPLEYYSILSLVADRSLSKMGLLNVNDFFGTFMEAENEYEFKADGTYQKKTDIRRFRNFRQFRKLLDTYIDFKEGDAEGIVRPSRVQKTYEIPQNQFGLDMEQKAQEIFKENERESGKGAKVLRAITELRKIAFSPYASKFSADISASDYKRFVDDSPKIKTLMGLIAQNKKDTPEAGQLVYVDQVGVEFLPLMRDYLIKELGYAPSEVEIISGATAKQKRVEIQDKYNAGDIKIILGSEAIKEGMNLQENTSDLYILSLPWNFTQLRQVIGRAWRQGNRWKNVRINNLFIQDSVDIFLSQKLENKQKRYEAAIKSGDNEVDVGDVSFDEMKFDLIRDPNTRAKLELAAEKERLSQEITQEKAELAFATRKLDKINELAEEINDTQKNLAEEKKKQEEALKKGEEHSTFWIDRYTNDLAKFKKQQTEELAKLQEKGIDTEVLLKKRVEGDTRITALEAQVKALDENFDARLKEIAKNLPERKPFTPAIVDALVAQRAQENADFYQLRTDPTDEVVKVEEKVKEIKNAAGTKVLKTKKTTVAVSTKKPKVRDGAPKDAATFAILNDSKLSTTEKVDKLLEVKQKGKDFKDVGERVSGSKKERAAIRAVMESGSDDVFTEMVNRLGVEAVLEVLDKAEILDGIETPNPAKDKEAGVPSLVAFTKKDIFDKIQRRFSFRQGRGRYKDFVAWRQAEGSSGWTSLDAKDKEYAAEVIKEYPSMLRLFVQKLTAIKTAKDLADFGGWYTDTFSEYEVGTLYNEKIKVGKNVFGDAVANYKPFVPNVYSYDNGKDMRVSVSRRYSLRSFDQELKPAEQALFDKEMNAEKWWEKAIKKGGKREEDTELKHGNFKPLERVERSAPAIPEDRVNPETLTTDYGFKSVQFGNYMDDATSREHIRHTIGALEDMAVLLDIDVPKMIAETGLSMAYGARGGGGANAHYEPAKNIINLTKGRGDGSFFHEFVHYMDLTLGGRYRGKWSSKKTRWYIGDTLDEAAVKLMDGLTGRHGRKVKEFVPKDDPYIREKSPVLEWYRDNLPIEEAVEKAKNGVFEYRGNTKVYTFTEGDLLQNVADIYRKNVKAEVDFWHDETAYYKGSKSYGGDYWSRPEELLARAGQAYIEDKLAEKGMENNYLTRPTVGEEGSATAKVYPQGEERKQFNQLFDNLFAELRRKYPRTEVKFKKEGAVKPTYQMTEAGRYLADLKNRLNIDFDVYFVDTILADKKVNPLTRKIVGRVEAYGATADNTIALVREMAAYTAEHETVHLTLANLEKIPVFRNQGLTKRKILEAKAQQMGIEVTESSINRIEEEIALDFERYVDGKHEPKGILRRFFALLKQALVRFARAIGMTRGDIITNYFEILDEGRAVEEEVVRLENKGIMESYIEDGVLDTENMEVLLSNRIKPMEAVRANEIADRIEATNDITKRAAIFDELSDAEIQALAVSTAGGRIWRAMGQEFAAILDYAMRDVKEEFHFKIKDEGDKNLQKIERQFNELAEKQEQLENDVVAWKTDLDQEMIRRENTAEAVAVTPENVKEAARFTTRKKPPVGELTPRGVSEVENLGFANPQEAQVEVSAYLKRKAELVETRNRLRTLRRDIAKARTGSKETKAALRDVERRLKLRKRLLEQKDFYVGMGFKQGRKAQMRMIRLRGRAVKNAQDFFMISDKKAKDIIAGRRIHLMSEEQFNNFLVEFSNKAQVLRETLDARDEVKALIQEQQFNKVDNLRLAMGLPAIEKMNEAEARRLVDVLSKYQFGDTFLTKRELETIHRTKWGEMKTERELLAKMKEHTGTGREELKTLTAPENGGDYTPWIKLARSHPFYNWLIGKRVEASIKAEREYVSVEEEVNALTRAARSSRRKKLSLGKKAVEMLVPTDEIVFNYIESKEKEKYAKEKDMTVEELALADYLINLYQGAYEYMQSEYGMRGRENYMTHVRRSFFEAMKESGVMSAFREIMTSQKEEEAAFKILDEETGEVLAFEKFFGFALRRTGALVPTKNIARASLSYFNAFAKKKAMDEFIPEALVAVQAHKAVVGMTEKGLTKDPTFEKFVKRFLNDAKGRKVWFITKQGSRSDIALRAATAWIAIKYLGFNAATAVANLIGDFTAVFWELSLQETAKGVIRSFNIPQSHEINQQFRYFTGRNPLVELFDPKYNMPSRLLKSVMVLMSLAAFQSNKFFLRAKMTDEEFRTGVLEDKRLTEIAQSLSRVKPNAFYVRSLAGNTTAGKATFQFGTWAISIFNTVTSDAAEVVKMLKDKKGWDTVNSKEAQKLTKFVIMGGLAMVLASMIEPPDDDDDSFFAQVLRKAQRELTTLFQALQFVTNPANYALIVRELADWRTLLAQLLSQEKYKADGEGYGIGDPKWTRTGERLITPSAFKHFFPTERENTRERLLDEAVESGEFDAEATAEFLNPDDWNNVNGERTAKEQEEYRAKKVGELTALYNFKRKYPESVIGNIVLEESKNDDRVEKMIEYAKEVGVDEAYTELKTLYKDKELCANQKNKTGCLISGQLFKDFQRAKKLLDNQ